MLEHPLFAEGGDRGTAEVAERATRLIDCGSMNDLVARYYARRGRDGPGGPNDGRALLIERAAYWRRCCALVGAAVGQP